MTKVVLDRTALDAFCAQWPCHGFPDALDTITFEFAANGDLVDITAKAVRGRVLDSADFDGPALVALADDAKASAAQVAEARELVGLPARDVVRVGATAGQDDEPITPVIFRRMNKGHGGEIIAVFPTDAASFKDHECGCYIHVGQHSACDPWHIMRNSKPATPAEYADLRAELEGAPYGYRFKVYTRLQRKWHEERAAELHKQGGAKIPKCGCDEREEIINRLSRGA